ncbi:hypothetical protein [Cohnella soli]|uniref:Uncharacterized protein n=1 Tax=Cohnella soli TaxID=425005 RepID=A0ABW0HRQ4_9BACL
MKNGITVEFKTELSGSTQNEESKVTADRPTTRSVCSYVVNV